MCINLKPPVPDPRWSSRTVEACLATVVALGVALAGLACGGKPDATSGRTGRSSADPITRAGAPFQVVAATTGEPDMPAHFAGLAPGPHECTRFAPMISAELASVQDRFAASAAANADWLQGHIARHHVAPGQRLPYDAKFGITDREYDLLASAYERPKIVDQDRFDLAVRRDSRGLHFDAPSPYALLNDIVIEEGGRLTYGSEAIDAPQPASLTGQFGPWSGYAWRRSASSPPSNLDTIDVEVGHTKEPRRRFMHVSRLLAKEGRMLEQRALLIWVK